MYPYVSFFGKPYSSYGVFAIIGLAAAVLYSFIVHKITKDKKDFYDRVIYIVYCGAAGGICAAILYQLTNIKGWIKALPFLFTDFDKFKSYLSFGIVFYGGMFGIFIGFMIYSRFFKEDTREWLRTSVPGVPLFHAFGRMGCAVGGCCYGIPKLSAGSYNYETGLFDLDGGSFVHGACIYNARIGHYCIPIQLIESCGLILIVIILILYLRFGKDKKAYYRPMGLYFVMYGVLRFITEFWRGDLVRGIWGPFSTSQYISMIVIPIGIYCLVCPTEKNIFEKWYNGALYKKDKETDKEKDKEKNIEKDK